LISIDVFIGFADLYSSDHFTISLLMVAL